MPTKDGKHAYSDEEKAEIIAHVLVNVACGRPVDRIFREDDLTENGIHMPHQSCFWKWLFADETGEIGEKLARAREFGIEALLDKAIAIAEQPMIGEEITYERDPEMQKDRDDGAKITKLDGSPYEGMVVKAKKADMLGHRKLYIETMLKAAQMLKPKTYGPKLDLTSGGDKIKDVATTIAEMRQRVKDGLAEKQEGEDQ